jgi:hypothetical protein
VQSQRITIAYLDEPANLAGNINNRLTQARFQRERTAPSLKVLLIDLWRRPNKPMAAARSTRKMDAVGTINLV